MFEIFDQQESFKLDMIDLACGVIRISIKCSCLEIFDQQGNPNLIPLVIDSLSYHLVSELQAQDRIYVSFAFLLNLIFIYLYPGFKIQSLLYLKF